MPNYRIGSKVYILGFDAVVVLKQLIAQVTNKLGVPAFATKVLCGNDIDHEWLVEVLEEVERWYLDDYDPENEQMVIPKEDVAKFKELSELLNTVLKQNERKKEKFVTTAQAQVLSKSWTVFLGEFSPQDQSIPDFHRRGRFITKNDLNDLVTRVQAGIESGKKIRWQD